MLFDLNETAATPPSGRFDFAIIGAGAAGITLALSLERQGFRVALVESGGRSREQDSQKLYTGKFVDDFKSDSQNYCITSRVRALGGSTNHWTGYCAPFDEDDFMERPWVPNSGWPISASDITGYYNEAADILGIRGFDNTPYSPGRSPARFGAGSGLRDKIFHLSPPVRFNERYGQALTDSKKITLLLHANFTSITKMSDRGEVEVILVQNLGGRRVTLRSKVFVLAAGGLENARLLLHFNRRFNNRLGNQSRRVGAFFMDHLLVSRVGRVWLSEDLHRFPMLTGGPQPDATLGHKTSAAITVSAELRAKYRLPNFCAHLATPSPKSVTNPDYGSLAAYIDALRRPSPPQGAPPKATEWSTGIILECPVDQENRVSLIDSRDALGMPQIKVQQSLPDSYSSAIRRVFEALAKAFAKEPIGRARLHLRKPHSEWIAGENFTWWQCHHIGTTRMALREADGVVDSNQKLFGTTNFYVAGSSVFCTGSYVNPTFTIIAMTLRLAKHLKEGFTTT